MPSTSEEEPSSSVECQRLPSIRELFGRLGLPPTTSQSVFTYQDDQTSVTSTLPSVAHTLASPGLAYDGLASPPVDWAPTTPTASPSMFVDPPTPLPAASASTGRHHYPTSPYARYQRRRTTTTTRLRTHDEALVESGFVVPYESVSERASSTSDSSRGTSSPMPARPQSSPSRFSSLTSDPQVGAGGSQYLTRSSPQQGSEALSPASVSAADSTSRRGGGVGPPPRQQQQRWQLPPPPRGGGATTRRAPRRPSISAGPSTAAAAEGRDLLRPFHCSECGQCFTRRHDLRRHTRTHTGERRVFFSTHTHTKGVRYRNCLAFRFSRMISVNFMPMAGKAYASCMLLLFLFRGDRPFACGHCGQMFTRVDACKRVKITCAAVLCQIV